MTKTKWMLVILGIMDLILVLMHYTGYVIFLLKPTGYIIPLVINIVIIIVIVIQSKLSKIWTIMVTILIILISVPILLFYSLLVWIQNESYTEIDNPYKNQSLKIEYRHATLGETTYFYTFYKMKFGFLGKRLTGQEISIITRHYGSPIDAEGVLGLGNEEWITPNTVRFHTIKGMKDVYLSSSSQTSEKKNMEEAIEIFMEKAQNQENGQTLHVNGIQLTTRYDAKTDQEWIDVSNKTDQGTIPTQQCARLAPNKEYGYFMLEECTHQWEYALYPMSNSPTFNHDF